MRKTVCLFVLAMLLGGCASPRTSRSTKDRKSLKFVKITNRDD